MEDKVFAEIMESLYTYYRIISSYQNTPRTYGTDELLYQTEVHTIQMIGDNPGMSLNELADKTYRTKSAMSVLIKALAEKDLVTRKRDEEDNRKYIITLAKKGQDVYEYHSKLDKKNYRKILDEVNSLEKVNLNELKTTLKLLDNLNKVQSIQLAE